MATLIEKCNQSTTRRHIARPQGSGFGKRMKVRSREAGQRDALMLLGVVVSGGMAERLL